MNIALGPIVITIGVQSYLVSSFTLSPMYFLKQAMKDLGGGGGEGKCPHYVIF